MFLLCSSFGWGCVLHLFCWVVLLGHPPLALFPLSFYVVLLGFFPLWVVLLFSFSCLVALSSSSFGWGSFIHHLLLGGAVWFHSSFWLLDGVAVFPSPVWWCCLPYPPLGGEPLPKEEKEEKKLPHPQETKQERPPKVWGGRGRRRCPHVSHRFSMIFLLGSGCCSSLRWKKGKCKTDRRKAKR